ncbi:MAG: hypothetical protein AAGB35_07120 [Pseudomonadota bacterium]
MEIKGKGLTQSVIALVSALAILIVTGCGGAGSGGEEQGVIINGDFALVYAERNMNALGNPTDGVRFSPGGDLFIKSVSAPLTDSTNLTSSYTQGAGDVSDPDVNFEGNKVVFAMRGPNDSTFNIWEYDLLANTMQRLIEDDDLASRGNDVDPTYLPDGRIVFSSDRQETTYRKMADENVAPYKYLDEYERERSIVLHTFDPLTQEVKQISFNQSHDRNATVLRTGEILYARWDHVANRNHFPLFITNPDGTGLFVEYGAFSPGNSFLHPREMPDGRIMTTLMPLSGTNEAGAVMIVNTQDFTDACHPNSGPSSDCRGQKKIQLTNLSVNFTRDFAPGGRFTTPYPLWDGTNRALVAFKPAPPNPTTFINAEGETVIDQGTPNYSIYMMDLDNETMRPVQLATNGKALIDPIPIIARSLSDVPTIINDKFLDPAMIVEDNSLGGEGIGVMNVRSVYDTDFLDIMGDRVLAQGETIPVDANGKPDLAAMKDPNNPAFVNRVARFVRVTRAIPTPPGMRMDTIGESNYEMQEILGYTQVEPDGSFRVKVPADTSIAMAVLDSQGRAFQSHTNWLQVRPGEIRTCNGCHSPRGETAPLNTLPVAGNHTANINSWDVLVGETMADTRNRNDSTTGELTQNITYTPIWAALSIGGIQQTEINYDELDTPSPITPNGQIRINYEDHIQPIWDKSRADVVGMCANAGSTGGAGDECTCVSCHNNPQLLNASISAGLTLEGGLNGLGGRMISYDQLLMGTFQTDSNGVPLPPVLDEEEGLIFLRNEALVNVGSSRQSSRSSHLTETIFHTKLRASADHVIGSLDHSAILTSSEKRLISEWIDIGAQYINDPFELDNGVYKVKRNLLSNIGVDQSLFVSTVQPRLLEDCQSCHSPAGDRVDGLNNDPNSHEHNRFVLTGSPDGDFNVTIAMINDLCSPADSDLLLRPISDNVAPNLPHPQILVDPTDPLNTATQPVLIDTSPNSTYGAILNWITVAADNNPTC